ncbi:MAG: PQQ-binding-like beta-propeller repeat protein, partial [Alphaproteobacteria bacterium]|nr:PQQ-binding-like beta-propeller repeat protein [Alphaproteobacteria bacterium]
VLSGCSSEERLEGKREELIVSEVHDAQKDLSPVVIDADAPNAKFAQAFMNPTHNYAPLRLSPQIQEAWSAKLDFEASSEIKMTASPVVADGKVFCADAAGIVYAFDQSTGERLWRVSTTLVGKDGQIGSAIAYDNGRVIVSSSFAECFALDAADGKILWRVKLPAPCKGDGITVIDGKAFVLCANSSMYALSTETGKILWSHSGMLADAKFIGSASVAVEGGVVYLAYPSGEVFALAEDTGAQLWDAMLSKYSLTNSAKAISHPRACPVIKDDLVYFVVANNQTVALDKKTGRTVWHSDFGGVQTPSVSGNSVFVFNENSELVCLNSRTGKFRWSTKITSAEEERHNWFGQLLIKDYVLMISPEGYIHFISVKDGKEAKIIEIDDEDDGISVNPAIAGGMMFIPMNCGRIVAYK